MLTCWSVQLCKACFFQQFEDETHRTIVDNRLFVKGDRVAIGASGELFDNMLQMIMIPL